MIAGCLNTTAEFAVMSMRLTLCLAALLVIRVAARTLYRRRLGLIPNPIWFFTGFWATVMFLTAGASALSCSPIRSGWFLVVYGSSFAWTIIGLVWVIVTAETSLDESVSQDAIYTQAVQHLIDGSAEPPEE